MGIGVVRVRVAVGMPMVVTVGVAVGVVVTVVMLVGGIVPMRVGVVTGVGMVMIVRRIVSMRMRMVVRMIVAVPMRVVVRVAAIRAVVVPMAVRGARAHGRDAPRRHGRARAPPPLRRPPAPARCRCPRHGGGGFPAAGRLGLEAQDLLAIFAHLAVHVVGAFEDLVQAIHEGFDHEVVGVEIAAFRKRTSGMLAATLSVAA